jgi:prepilin-type N-terminal cleavage/methylation domain-containing protein
MLRRMRDIKELLNNKGFTLVEMVVAFAILAVT